MTLKSIPAKNAIASAVASDHLGAVSSLMTVGAADGAELLEGDAFGSNLANNSSFAGTTGSPEATIFVSTVNGIFCGAKHVRSSHAWKEIFPLILTGPG